ncbi:MAG: Metallo-beta-lactamase superfamily, partial [Gaiellaceae bacterium]|nr:Metallo-beta-lactamase superfamily [Gaiellaceae bacterium]
SPADWPAEVGCVAYQAPGALVLIDPLVVDDDFGPLDELAESSEHVSILTTVQWHGRSREELRRRYKASGDVPEGVQAFEISGAGETIFWIPEHKALVPGDRILGDRPPGLRLCPESWLRYLGGYTLDDLRAGLKPLLELPVELVLVSHGEPVLEDGHDALAHALA